MFRKLGRDVVLMGLYFSARPTQGGPRAGQKKVMGVARLQRTSYPDQKATAIN